MAKEKESQSLTGKILTGVGGLYSIWREDGQIVEAKPRGIFRKDGTVPYPGDNIRLSASGDPDIPFCIDSICPRSNFLLRPAIANLDLVMVTVSAADPPPDGGFIDKMLIPCVKSAIDAAICVTKADLAPEAAADIQKIYGSAGFRVFVIGTGNEYDGIIADIREFIRKKTITFAGQSGVGKSTAFNRVIDTERMLTGGVSRKSRRGRHTTRHSEIIAYADGFVADTPGFSALQIADVGVTGEEVLKAYPEILQFSGLCRFGSCRHSGDKGCAVREADIDPGRLQRYRAFRKEADAVNRYENKKNFGGQSYGA